MDFTLSDQQQAFVDMATEFADDELAPFALEWTRRNTSRSTR